MRRLILLSMALCAIAGPMQAASRFNCAVDDENIRLSIDTGFAGGPGHKLNHFRGAFIGKAAGIPTEFQKIVFDSNQLTQSWSHDGELRLALASNGQGENNDKSFELFLSASGKDDSVPMVGTYALTVWGAVDAPPVQLTGRLACNTK